MTETRNLPKGESLGIGGIIGGSFSLTFSNFLGLLGLIIVPFILAMVVSLIVFGTLPTNFEENSLAMQEMILDDPTGFWIRYGVLMIFNVLSFSFFYAAAIRLYFDGKLGQGNLSVAFAAGLSGMIPVFVMYLVMSVFFMVVMVVLGGLVGFLAGVTGSEAIGFVFGIGLAVFALWLFAALSPFLAIVVVEKKWFGAFGRSFGLTKEYRWPIVGLLIVFLLTLLVVTIAVGLLFYVTVLVGGIIGTIVGMLVYLVMTLIVGGAAFALVSLIYARLREIKEGASIQSLADVFS